MLLKVLYCITKMKPITLRFKSWDKRQTGQNYYNITQSLNFGPVFCRTRGASKSTVWQTDWWTEGRQTMWSLWAFCVAGTKKISTHTFDFDWLTCFSDTGNSKSFTSPKSSPVASALPRCERCAQFTSAFAESLGQMPTTSSPSVLK